MSSPPDSGPSPAPPFDIAPFASADDVAAARRLFQAYALAIGVDLSFQGFDAELAALPGRYAPPEGVLLLARTGGGPPFGCVGLRPLDPAGTCEMKRLFVAPEGRGLGAGRALARAVVARARGAGYRRMVLDTLPSMAAAQSIYQGLGFEPTSPYYDNPIPGAAFLALDLGRPPVAEGA